MEITSVNNKYILYANSLKEKKYRDKENKFLIEGEHLLSMCNKEDIEAVFTTNTNYKPIIENTYYINEAIAKKLSSVEANQGLFAIVKKNKSEIDYSKKSYLLCDLVSDPGNMGTIIRTALAFNVDYVILEKGSVDIYNDKVIRGSQGAIFKIPVVYSNLEEVINNLKANNVKVFASTLATDSINLKTIKEVNKFALIVGNEGSGVRKVIQNAADVRVKIDHSNEIDSLNVGVATSIMLYYFDFVRKD